MYDFLRRPLWILSHVLVVLAVASMVVLGLWQKSRWDLRASQAAAIEQKANDRAVPFASLVPDGATEFPVAYEYRRVVVVGTYSVADEVVVRNRSQGGAPGGWVLTPLVRPDGPAVAVVRGWVPLSVAEKGPGQRLAAPPPGEVAVTGTVQPTQVRRTLGTSDPTTGRVEQLSRVDLPRLDAQFAGSLSPAWVLLDGQVPPQPDALPQPAQFDPPDASQNFSYMVQWWIFATIAAVGYPLILRRVARNRARGEQVPVTDLPDGGP